MNESVSCIYAITNWVTGCRYIGSAVNFHTRKLNHLLKLRRGSHFNSHLQPAWSKYGEKSFGFGIITKIDLREDLLMAEQAWLDSYLPEYNVARIAGSTLGVKHTDAARKKISERGKGRKLSEDARRKLVTALTGRPCSKETRKKLSIAQTGRQYSSASKEKMRNSRLGKVTPDATKKKLRLAMMGRQHTLGYIPPPEVRKKISVALTGLKRSPETRIKMSIAAKFRHKKSPQKRSDVGKYS